jgi:hypothetical protein
MDTANQKDYTLANPDTLTKYKEAGEISQKVLAAVAGMYKPHIGGCHDTDTDAGLLAKHVLAF